ncbi:hypothetical protein ACIBK1_02335 [Microbispora rosea]|uniref:hypothetical protein n=1 Tax=Microbispora rosea TaxID=58117 RepID=UPI00068FDF86|nr:hypothetical protein [Microbispora rosea]
MLGEQWADGLGTGLGDLVGFDVRMAYYAPFLNAVVAQGGDGLDHLPGDVQDMITQWAGLLEPMPDDVAQGYATVPIRMIIDRIAKRRRLNRLMLRTFVAVFFREVAAYMRDGAGHHAARDAVADAIAAHRAQVVIAHSLGSVVAYEALWHRPELEVELLVTLGSPLGMPGVIFERLRPAPGERGERPPGVRHWINIADVGDIIAIPRPFTRRFTPDANYEETIGLLDFHTASGYLAHRRTLAALSGHLQGPSNG